MSMPALPLAPAPVRSPPLGLVGLGKARHLGRGFWTLYASSCLVDLGLCLYFFMFSLFLVEHRFSVHAIGFITSAQLVGNIAGMVPASLMSRRFGLRRTMLVYLWVAPICLASRSLFLQMPAQIVLAFVSGAGMSLWAACFSPALAKLTTRQTRASGFSLFVATGIASGALAGVIGGYLPGVAARLAGGVAHVDGVRAVLLLACAIIASAGFTVSRLRIGQTQHATGRAFGGFLLRFLVAIAVWNFAISFFTPFANVFLSRHLGLPLPRIGVIFTVSQVFQVAAVLLAPLLYRRVGLVTGIAITQLSTASMLWALSRATGSSAPLCFYIVLTGVQWMGGAGIASLLMDRTPEAQRSHAAAMHNVVNLSAQAAAAAIAGRAFERFGYAGPLAADACLAALAAILFFTLLGRGEERPNSKGAHLQS